VHGLPVLIVSGIASLVMLCGALLLGRDVELAKLSADSDEHDDLNVRAVLSETAADAAAAAGVALSGAIIYATGSAYWLDPAVALIIAAVIAYHAVRLLVRIRRALRVSLRVQPRRPGTRCGDHGCQPCGQDRANRRGSISCVS
jgi:cobalt-zinc-cadmium efflux system protein